MKRVGVTGGIGSGKSTFCAYLRELGVFVVDLDLVARDVLTHDVPVKQDVLRIFGEQAYLDNGRLNRAYLAKEAFSEGKIGELIRIVHPAVFKRLRDMEAFAEEEGVKVFVRESAILLNDGRPPELDVVVLISVPDEERIRRVMERDGSTRQEVLDRLRRQKTDEQIRPLCDLVIDNTGGPELLRTEALRLCGSWGV